MTEGNVERVAKTIMVYKINKANKAESEELTEDIYNNQYDNDFKIVLNNKNYDLKNAKKI